MFLKLFKKKSSTRGNTSDSTARLVEGIDREMNYCPQCAVEYRSDIESCSSCQVGLITGEAKIAAVLLQKRDFAARSIEIGPEDTLISIRKGGVKDIKVLQQLLIKERIPAILAGDEESCGKGCCGPEMYLQIREQDLEAATDVLAKDYVATTALDLKDLEHAEVVFDQQAAETLCPACGCLFSPTVGACPDCGLCFE